MSTGESDNLLELNPEILKTQREARNMVKRDARILMALLFGTFAIGWILDHIFKPSGCIFFASLLGLLTGFLLASNWRQWAALIKFDLHCPHCNLSLADKVHIFKSPNHNCPHCGKRALATIEQLKRQDNFS